MFDFQKLSLQVALWLLVDSESLMRSRFPPFEVAEGELSLVGKKFTYFI